MTDEQFAMFTASYADAPGQAALGQHATDAASFGTPTGDGAEDPEVESARRIYNRHVLAGMRPEQLRRDRFREVPQRARTSSSPRPEY